MSNVSLLGGCLPINTSSATVEEATTSHLWMIGVVLMLIGCASSATGLLFMKQSSVMGEGKKTLCRRWRWITGFVLLVVNAIWIDIIAFSITPMALIAPFAGMTIVFTLLISATGCVTKREVPSRWEAAYVRAIPGGRDLSGILLVLLGVTLVSVFGPHGDGSPEALHFSFRSALLAAGVAGYIAAWLVLHCLSTRRRRAADPPPGGALPPALSHRSRAARALSDEIAEESADAAAAGTAPPTAAIGGGAQASAVETIGTCLASAMCGMATQVALKQVSKVVTTSFLDLSHLGEAGWAEPITWAAFVLLPCSAPLQLWLLNKALAGAKVSYSVPAYQSLLIVMNLLAAGIFYDEFTCHPEVVPFVAGGILAVIAGLGVLSLTNRDAEGEANRDQRSTLLTDELVASSTPGRLAPERSDSDEPPSLPAPPGQACVGAASTAPPLPSHVPVGVEVRSGEEGAGEERLSHPPHVTAEKARASMRQMASDLEAAFEGEGEEEARRPGTPVCGHTSSIRSSVDSLSLEAAEV